MILPHTDRIQSLRIDNPFAAEMFPFLSPMINPLNRLETLIINDTDSNYIEAIVSHLSSLPALSSLTIKSISIERISTDIYRKIFRLPALKYCQMSIAIERHNKSLPIATNEFSPIEHLIIKNEVLFSQLDTLLSYVPQLRRLSLGDLTGFRNNRIRRNSVILNHLTNISLELFQISFHDFEVLVKDFFRQVQILHFTTAFINYFVSDKEFVNPNRWQQLILTYMPNLRLFDYQQRYYSWRSSIHSEYQSEINNFSSVYWIEHQWFLEYQQYTTGVLNNAILYSTNPYKRKSYSLMGVPTNINHQIDNVDSVRLVCIHNRDAMEQFGSRFTNANELILTKDFDIPSDWTETSLSRIIPLTQLGKLTLHCHDLAFEQLVELLHFTSNIHTLTLNSVLIHRAGSRAMQAKTLFQLVSERNTVTNLTVDKPITLKKIQLLVALFPRLESLIMNLHQRNLKPIVRFLLSTANKNTRQLFSLCLSEQGTVLIEKLHTLIESKKLLQDYSLKLISEELYLWW